MSGWSGPTVYTIRCRLYGTTAAGAESDRWTACELLGRPRRSVGLYGDALAVKIPYNGLNEGGIFYEFPDEWDLTKEFKLQIGDSSPGGNFKLGGYYLRQRRQVEWGEDPDTSVARFFGIVLTFTTIPGKLRDGRGGLLTAGTINRTDRSGRVDTADPDYKTTQELVDLCLAALDVAHDPVPSQINIPVDGSTTIEAPGPLDWGLARALPELEAILARVGWTATLKNDGSGFVVHRLRRAGETITLPSSITTFAEPYSLETGAGVRPKKVVVTSGRTRSTIFTDRSIDPTGALGRPLEWVAFDSRTGTWLNNTEWTTLYATEDGPGDLTVFQAGPGGPNRSVEEMRAFGRMFRAVRLHEDDRPGATRFVTVPEVATVQGEDFGKVPAVVIGRYCVSEGAGQLLNEPISAAEPRIRLDGVQAVAGEGVFVLPTDAVWVRMSPGPKGSYANAALLGDADLVVCFAHEADSGDWRIDYFTSGWQLVEPMDDVVTVEQLNLDDLTDAIADPDVVKIEAPWLRRLVVWTEADQLAWEGSAKEESDLPVAMNDTELHAVAEQLALARIADSGLASGVIELRGILNIEPGTETVSDFGGAVDLPDGTVSAVEWDLPRMRTIVYINTHETPQGFYDQLEGAARRSIGAGMGRFSIAGSSAGRHEVRSGSTPGDTTVGAGSGGLASPEAQSGTRGADAAVAARPDLATGDGRGRGREDRRSDVASLMAKIIDYTALGPDRWKYAWEEVYWNGTNWASTGGANYLTHGYAYNGCEWPNDGSGVEGNSIDADGLTGTYALQPIGRDGNEVVVELRGPFSDGGASPVYVWHFALMNSVDGDCE